MKTILVQVMVGSKVLHLPFEEPNPWNAYQISLNVHKTMRFLGVNEYQVISINDQQFTEVILEDIYLN